MKRLLGVFLAVAMFCSMGMVAASAYEPTGGGVFNVPKPWGSTAAKYRIVDNVVRAIRNVPGSREGEPKERILISTYLMDHAGSVDALIGACKRGVSVRVIMDQDIDNRQSRRLITALNADNVKDANGNGIQDPEEKSAKGPCNTAPVNGRAAIDSDLTTPQLRASVEVPTEDAFTWGEDRSYVKKCRGSCRGAGGNMHSKFFAFSRTGTANNTVIVSSSNLNRGGAVFGWNDSYTMKNRPVSFAYYNRIHREMTDDVRAGGGLREIQDGPYTSRFFPMANAGKRNDPTLRDLNKIGCRSSFGRTQVHVSMFYWQGPRGEYLAQKLLQLARAGCRVSAIYGAPGKSVSLMLRKAARTNLIRLYDSRWDFNKDKDGLYEVRTHAKYVLVKGRYGSNPASHQVLTGSQNWVAGSLMRGDEVTLNIALRSAWNQYVKNWNDIARHSRRLPESRY